MTTPRVVAISMALACVLVAGAPIPRAWAVEGYATFGGQWWTQSFHEAKFQEFREVPQGALISDFLLRESQGKNNFTIWGANSIRSDQATRASLSNGARWRLDGAYTQIPHTFSFIARSGWAQTSPGVFLIADSIQAANQRTPASYTARMNDYLNTSPNVPLTFRSDITSLRLRNRPTRDWQLEARGSRRQRVGQKSYAMSFGFSTALENPEPIDQDMVDGDLIANYRKKALTAQVDLGVSSFDNAVSTLYVDNPKRVTDLNGGDGAKIGGLDLYPNNRQYRGSVALGYTLPLESSLNAMLALSRTEQDDPFLPFTNNKAIPQSSMDSLPARSADAKAMQLNGDIRLRTHPLAALDGTLRFHYDDYDNQTPVYDFIGRVPYDASFQRYIELENKPFGNTHWFGGAEAEYHLGSRASLGGMFEYHERERTHREVEKNHETVLGARARIRPLSAMSLEARYTHGDRQLDEFNEEEYFGLRTRLAAGSNPALFDSLGQLEQLDLRRYDVANRVRDQVGAGASYAFSESFDVGVNYAFLRDDYKDTELGLQDETGHNIAAFGTWHVNEKIDLLANYGWGHLETNQTSRQSGSSIPSTNPLDNWSANLTDTEVYVGAGLSWIPPLAKVTFDANYTFSRHLAGYNLTNAANTAQSLPTTWYRLHDLVVDTRYRWLERITLTGRYAWEEYDIDDWATNDVPLIFPTTGTSNAIFLGDSSESYRAHRLALLATYTF